MLTASSPWGKGLSAEALYPASHFFTSATSPLHARPRSCGPARVTVPGHVPESAMQRADGELAAGDYRDLGASRAVPLPMWAGLAGVMALGLGLRLWRLGQNGYGTEYYSAGVRSMMDSPHNFFFNSFDPAGFVSLDKPPVALWIQVASVKLLGFNGLAVLLPQVLEGLASIALVYWLVARRFGEGAGLLAALFLAVTPISVVIDRSTNTDSCLVLVLLLAAWALAVATERGSGALVALAMALVGVGFNVKMLAAFVVLPTLALLGRLLRPDAGRATTVRGQQPIQLDDGTRRRPQRDGTLRAPPWHVRTRTARRPGRGPGPAGRGRCAGGPPVAPSRQRSGRPAAAGRSPPGWTDGVAPASRRVRRGRARHPPGTPVVPRPRRAGARALGGL